MTAHAHATIPPSIEASPYAGQVWAIEAELTPKPAARPVVARAAGSLPPGEQARVVIRDLPPAAFTPEARS